MGAVPTRRARGLDGRVRRGGASAEAGSKRGDASAEEDASAEADVVHTSLCIAMEDDAFKSRTAVPLPIDAYVKRVDKLVNEFMQRDYESLVAAGTTTTRDVIDALEDYLYVQNQYRAPKGWREMYSPYRTYFHNVVAQKIGHPRDARGDIHRLRRASRRERRLDGGRRRVRSTQRRAGLRGGGHGAVAAVGG